MMNLREHEERMKAMRAEGERAEKFVKVFLVVIGSTGIVLAALFIAVGIVVTIRFLNGDFSR